MYSDLFGIVQPKAARARERESESARDCGLAQ